SFEIPVPAAPEDTGSSILAPESLTPVPTSPSAPAQGQNGDTTVVWSPQAAPGYGAEMYPPMGMPYQPPYQPAYNPYMAPAMADGLPGHVSPNGRIRACTGLRSAAAGDDDARTGHRARRRTGLHAVRSIAGSEDDGSQSPRAAACAGSRAGTRKSRKYRRP